jgi:hypothetical protein
VPKNELGSPHDKSHRSDLACPKSDQGSSGKGQPGFRSPPHRYAANNRIRLDPGFTEALRSEVARLNQSLVDAEDKIGITLPRIDDPRTQSLPSFTIHPREVAALPMAAIYTVCGVYRPDTSGNFSSKVTSRR